MANKDAYKNGVKTRFKTGDERTKACARKSAESRKKFATFKECFVECMTDDMRKEMFNMLYERAKHGNLRAFEILRDTMWEKPKESVVIGSIDPETTKAIEDFLNDGTAEKAIKGD